MGSLKKAHKKKLMAKEKKFKVHAKEMAEKAKASRKRHIESAQNERTEKWTRPFWDVESGYGKCTPISKQNPKDACSLYSSEHCKVPGAKGEFKRIDSAQNCKWAGSFVIKGCSYRCARTGQPPKGWNGPAIGKIHHSNYQKDLFKATEDPKAPKAMFLGIPLD